MFIWLGVMALQNSRRSFENLLALILADAERRVNTDMILMPIGRGK
jgi:hypothetical protein